MRRFDDERKKGEDGDEDEEELQHCFSFFLWIDGEGDLKIVY